MADKQVDSTDIQEIRYQLRTRSVAVLGSATPTLSESHNPQLVVQMLATEGRNLETAEASQVESSPREMTQLFPILETESLDTSSTFNHYLYTTIAAEPYKPVFTGRVDTPATGAIPYTSANSQVLNNSSNN